MACSIFLYGSDGKESSWNSGDLGWSLGWEDPLEKEMATHSSTLAWKIPRTEKPGSYCPQSRKRVLATRPLGKSQPHYNLDQRKKWKKVKLLSRIRLFETPWTVARQDPLSMEFSRGEYWNGLFLLQRNFLTQEYNPHPQHWRQIFYHLSKQGSHG